MVDGRRFSRRKLLCLSIGGALATGLAGCQLKVSRDPTSDPRPSTDGAQPTTSIDETRLSLLVASTSRTFRPVVELVAGSAATVTWLDANGRELASGVQPTIEFEKSGETEPRLITLVTEYSEVIALNLGFNRIDDIGRFSLEASYNKDPEPVIGVFGLGLLSNLRRFMAANTPLTGTLDLSDMATLEHVECFGAEVEAVRLEGCTSLIRLCLEKNRLSELDLNPVAESICDLRAAAQKEGSLTLKPLTEPLRRLHHFCVRDQEVLGHPAADRLPSCEELLNWNTKQAGPVPVPPVVVTLACSGNAYTSADLSGLWRNVDVKGEVDLSTNKLTTISLLGCRGLRAIRLHGNSFSQSDVDTLINEIASWNTEGGLLSLAGPNVAKPSSSSSRQLTALRGRGWDVTVNDD